MKTTFILIILSLLFCYSNLFGWIFPEHRDITFTAIQKLSPDYREALDKLWAKARIGYENRLSEVVIDATQGTKPIHLDYATWPAVAGDHSCSARNMLHNILETDWILKVADIAAHLKTDITNSKNRHEHLNALRISDIKLQRADPEYATRAGSNNVHFLLARHDVNIDVLDYLRDCFFQGAELNALGAFAWFHISALLKASKYYKENLSDHERSALIFSALADEAYALHFLEDAFAAGHTAGTWGDAAQRKGTHDYFNERGLEITTWDGKRRVLTGDAFMRPEDAEFASVPVRTSIEQLIDAATGEKTFDYNYGTELIEAKSDSFNTCMNNFMPHRDFDPDLIAPCVKILMTTPIPGLAIGLGELPRFRSEIGTFIGIISAIHGSTVTKGFDVNQNKPGFVGGIDFGIRLGLGLEGVMHGGGDGLIFIDLGWRLDGPSTMKFGDSPVLDQGRQYTAAIPGRDAFDFRFRIPFWLIPFDMLISAPVLLIISPKTYVAMAVTSGLGGLIPWQTGIETGIGRFQFILGREVGLTLYGRGKNPDALLIPIEDHKTALINFKSTLLDFPVVEYRPFRNFATDQSSSMVFQLNFGVEFPHNKSIELPAGLDIPELRQVWYVGLRAAFDWRYYFK